MQSGKGRSKYIVEVLDDKKWVETSRHNNLEYAEANFETKAQRHSARIKYRGKVLKEQIKH